MKKLILFVVDACTSDVLLGGIEQGKLPNLGMLSMAGSLDPNCTTIFPSITPAATASIVTGCYPQEHGIAGAFWYDRERDEVAYYGDDFWVVFNEGIGTFFEDFLVKLNHERLRADTMFRLVERAGLRAACLNYFIFRGDVRHKVETPLLLSLLPGVPFSEAIEGPTVLCLGDFVTDNPDGRGGTLTASGGLLRKFGMSDEGTTEFLVKMIRNGALADFTLAYFPDYDFRSHKVGPVRALDALQNFDNCLGEIFEAFGGMDVMLREVCVMLTADHSQSDVLEDEKHAAIKLDEVLAGFEIADAGKPWEGDEQLMICPNMRVAQVYFRRARAEQIERVSRQLLIDPRVDQVMWRAALVDEKMFGYHIRTHDRGELLFWPVDEEAGEEGEGGGTGVGRDAQGCLWSWRGDLRTVGAKVSDEGVLEFAGGYPNAFERIVCGLEDREGGHLWVTALPGHEFTIPRTKIHRGGGSHGSLHALDSTVPLLTAGVPAGITVPERMRIVDVLPLCFSVLGIKSPRPVGSSHVTRLRA